MTQTKIAFIGAGNMATSLIGGLLKNGYDASCIYACDPDAQKLKSLEEKLAINISTDNLTAVSQADILVFAVKPNEIKTICENLKNIIFKNKPLIISIAAGIPTQKISAYLNADIPLVRCMPNTPALVGTGATVLFATNNVTEQQKNVAESILRAVGITIWVTQETLIDSATALSGSGPGYFFLIMEILEKIGIQMGLEPKAAHLLTLQTALGAAKLAIESDSSLEKLRQQVTSAGGTTEAGLNVFKQRDIERIFTEAVFAAKMRASELAND